MSNAPSRPVLSRLAILCVCASTLLLAGCGGGGVSPGPAPVFFGEAEAENDVGSDYDVTYFELTSVSFGHTTGDLLVADLPYAFVQHVGTFEEDFYVPYAEVYDHFTGLYSDGVTSGADIISGFLTTFVVQ